MEVGLEDVFEDVLGFVRNQGRMIPPSTKEDGEDDDEAVEIVLQTVDDIFSSASEQSLCTVSTT